MNTNLPIPYESEPTAMPYIRPHKKEKKRNVRRFMVLMLIIVLMTGAVLGFRFLPEDLWGWQSPVQTTASDGDMQGETTSSGETDGTTAPLTQSENIYEWNCELPSGATAILPCDLSANTLGVFAENPTDAVLESVTPVFPHAADGMVSVLILDTHSFESYAEDTMLYYTDPDFASNGANGTRVSSVAKTFVDALEEYGIGAVYVDCMAESGLGSYANARKMLELALDAYPHVTLVIDVHRGILSDDTGALLRPITAYYDEILAQARLLIGTDANFERNASAALTLFEMANMENAALMMPITVSEGTYLQSSPVPVLTLEIGTCGNTVSEAQNTAAVLGEIIARLLLE